ncbi:prolyl endopeptidase [Klebsiella pneumoniae]|uniref:Prolyl endopeptidase n=1 Tax=Klebsiella pneumoniae TaxID=573 RepID=A0A2X3IYC8_KLEPN|nr:prolyl endopeptidase [Klebsiella pneumoniae]
MMKWYCWRKADLIRYGIYREKVAPGHGLTHAGPIYRYSINSTYAHGSHYVVLSYAHCQAGQRTGHTASMYCAGLGLELLGSFTDHEGFSGIMLGARSGLASGIHPLPPPSRHPSPGDEICWCCTIRSRRHGRHSAQPWTPPDFCALRRLTLTGSQWRHFRRPGRYRTVLQNRAWAWCVIRRVWRRADAERGGR